jgi:acetone carboxylase gamma subunit
VGRTCGTYGEEEYIESKIVKCEGEESFCKPRNRWKENIKMDFTDIG